MRPPGDPLSADPSIIPRKSERPGSKKTTMTRPMTSSCSSADVGSGHHKHTRDPNLESEESGKVTCHHLSLSFFFEVNLPEIRDDDDAWDRPL